MASRWAVPILKNKQEKFFEKERRSFVINALSKRGEMKTSRQRKRWKQMIQSDICNHTSSLEFSSPGGFPSKLTHGIMVVEWNRLRSKIGPVFFFFL